MYPNYTKINFPIASNHFSKDELSLNILCTNLISPNALGHHIFISFSEKCFHALEEYMLTIDHLLGKSIGCWEKNKVYNDSTRI